jgi:hypothetical membrane protein
MNRNLIITGLLLSVQSLIEILSKSYGYVLGTSLGLVIIGLIQEKQK